METEGKHKLQVSETTECRGENSGGIRRVLNEVHNVEMKKETRSEEGRPFQTVGAAKANKTQPERQSA